MNQQEREEIRESELERLKAHQKDQFIALPAVAIGIAVLLAIIAMWLGGGFTWLSLRQ